MKAAILGSGWVTPLGTDLDAVYDAVEAGQRGEISEMRGALPDRVHRGMPVPQSLVAAVGRTPRLRRSSPISYFTATAGLAALKDAGLEMTPELAARTGLVFAVSSGSVLYTRRFYEQVIKAETPSPLLFPETVYNAPASHLAALLGITGQTYTLVGDAAVGLSALDFAAQLLAMETLDYCVVVGGEELDWVICEAYVRWRMNTVFGEGAAAVVLSREGVRKITTDPGAIFFKSDEGPAALRTVCSRFADCAPELVVDSENGTGVDGSEMGVLDEYFHGVPRRSPKLAFGESFGASAIQQVVYADVALRRSSRKNVLVTALGFNEQAGAVFLEQ